MSTIDNYHEPPYRSAQKLRGSSTDSGDDGWFPHQIRRPLLVQESDTPSFKTNPADIKEVLSNSEQDPPTRLDR